MKLVNLPPQDVSVVPPFGSHTTDIRPLSSLAPIPPPMTASDASTTSTLSAASTFDPYATGVSDYIHATSYQVAGVTETRAQKLFRRILNPTELSEWDGIERGMDRYMREVKWFSQFSKEKYALIKHRVGSQNFMSLRECYEGFDANEAAQRMGQLKTQGHEIIENVQKFRARTEDHLNKEHKKILRAVTGSFIGAVALTLVFFTRTGMIVAFATAEFKFGAGLGAVTVLMGKFFALFGVPGLGIHAACKGVSARTLKKNTDKAIAYLREVEVNLENLCKSLADVHACTREFAALGEENDRVYIQGKIGGIICDLDELIAVCDEAIESGKNKDDGSCTIM